MLSPQLQIPTPSPSSSSGKLMEEEAQRGEVLPEIT